MGRLRRIWGILIFFVPLLIFLPSILKPLGVIINLLKHYPSYMRFKKICKTSIKWRWSNNIWRMGWCTDWLPGITGWVMSLLLATATLCGGWAQYWSTTYEQQLNDFFAASHCHYIWRMMIFPYRMPLPLQGENINSSPVDCYSGATRTLSGGATINVAT